MPTITPRITARQDKQSGYMTTVAIGNIEFAIYSPSQEGLRTAFINIVGGRVYFDPQKIDRVRIHKAKT